MTETDRDPNDETGEPRSTDDTSSDDSASSSPRRGRTRRGRRGGRGRGGASDRAASPEDASAGDAGGEDEGSGGRRRRGRRGRGRGRGTGGATAPTEPAGGPSEQDRGPTPAQDGPSERADVAAAHEVTGTGGADATGTPSAGDGSGDDVAAVSSETPTAGSNGTEGTDPSEGESSGADAGGPAEVRTRERTERTRSRSRTSAGEAPRSRSGASRRSSGSSGSSEGTDDGRSGESRGSDDAGGSGGSRGTRGSGRSRGSGGSGRGSSGSGRGSGGTGAQTKKRSSSGGGRGGGGSSTSGSNGDAADESRRSGEDEVEEAIAKGGTRMAAKKGNRRGGGNGGNRRGQQRPGGVPEEVRRAILEGPPRTMLVTAREDRTQIAVLEDRTVVEHYVTRKEDVTYVGNIYMARVQNVLPGMEAAFLDIGKGRNGVLYAGEVLYDELDLEEGADERIENVLKPGQKVLVQVTKDPMGTKGPRLTMHLSLAGRYVVLAPNSDLFGISRKLTDRERDRLRRIVKKVKPSEHGVIVRTAAEGATDEQLVADMERLLAKWAKVEKAAEDAKALTAVYEEPPLVVKVIRDNFGPEFERCTVDDEDLYQQVRGYLEEVAEELLDKVELYGAPTADARARAAGAPPLPDSERPAEASSSPADPTTRDTAEDAASEGAPDTVDDDSDAPDADVVTSEDRGEDRASDGADGAAPDDPEGVGAGGGTGSSSSPTEAVDLAAAAERRASLPALFDAYDVSDQLRKAMGRKVWLPSGGYLIIETTEAMKVIDVNTGKFTGGKDTNLEEVVLKTNLEAADEIVRQLRLRDMGGIIIIDFIDMLLRANQEQVVRRLKRELLRDRTKTRVSDVSQLGLVQMTRKNVSQGLLESFSETCEACGGRGTISEIG